MEEVNVIRSQAQYNQYQGIINHLHWSRHNPVHWAPIYSFIGPHGLNFCEQLCKYPEMCLGKGVPGGERHICGGHVSMVKSI